MKKKLLEKIKKNITGITIGTILTLALGIYLLLQLMTGDANEITVIVDGKEQGVYSLHDSCEIRVETELGYNLLIIDGGQAYVAEADCKNQVCVHTEPIQKTGGQIVCLPHKIVIRLNNSEKSEIDAVSN